jgi:transposase
MARPATVIVLTPLERSQLRATLRKPKLQQRYVQRARIILLIDEGATNIEIARKLDVRPATVSKWRLRFQSEGLEGLLDDYRPGRPPGAVDPAELRRRLLAQLDQPVPKGYAQWNGRLLAEALGVNAHRVWRELRLLGINLQRRRSWCVSTDPEFAAKSADVIGLYLGPPGHAVVLCVDEKPCIQALEREQGWLKLPDGRALTGFAHEYKRHGTTNLFAALNVATGRVMAQSFPRKRREEFLRFLDGILAAYPGKDIHLVLDNLSVHKLGADHPWRQKHPQVHFHFTPTHASWLNQVEAWFSILSRSALKGASFREVKSLIAAMEAFIDVYNERAMPFVWTKVRVDRKTPSSKYADLIN